MDTKSVRTMITSEYLGGPTDEYPQIAVMQADEKGIAALKALSSRLKHMPDVGQTTASFAYRQSSFDDHIQVSWHTGDPEEVNILYSDSIESEALIKALPRLVDNQIPDAETHIEFFQSDADPHAQMYLSFDSYDRSDRRIHIDVSVDAIMSLEAREVLAVNVYGEVPANFINPEHTGKQRGKSKKPKPGIER
jgi:hypothetical protein